MSPLIAPYLIEVSNHLVRHLRSPTASAQIQRQRPLAAPSAPPPRSCLHYRARLEHLRFIDTVSDDARRPLI